MVRGNPRNVNISVNNLVIPQVTELKFLGRIISANLSIKNHYEAVKNKSESSIKLFQGLTSIRAGLHPSVGLNFYKSLVRSGIEYARTTACLANVNVINNKIASLQCIFLRRCLGLSPVTPKYLIYAFANELPPKERSVWLTAREIIKIKFFNPDLYEFIKTNKNVNSSYANVFREFEDIFENINTNTSFLKISNFDVTLKNFEGKKFTADLQSIRADFNQMLQSFLRSGFAAFATDASVGEESTGCAVYCIERNVSLMFRINRVVSSCMGELTAILQAVIVARDTQCRKLVIFTDSLVACQMLNQNSTTNFCVARIHNLIVDARFESVHVVWTPSHVGITFNEEADKIAKKAVLRGRIIHTDLSDIDGAAIIENSIFDEWYCDVLSQDRDTQSIFHKLFPHRRKKPWFWYFYIAPKYAKMINRIIAGRTYDKVYLRNINRADSMLCFCGFIESFQHLVFECPAFDSIRNKFDVVNKNDSCLDILIENKSEIWCEFAKFLEECKFNF